MFVVDFVASNADWVHTVRALVDGAAPIARARAAVARASMSVVVIYFGFRADGYPPLALRHHNIVLGARYEELLKDIFDRRILPADFSQYLHVPTLTDPSLAPPGHHAAYTLVPVPNLAADIDWDREGPAFVDRALDDIERRGLVPDLRARIVEKSFVDPRWFRDVLNTDLGSGFGLEPVLRQTAWMRPHLRSEDVRHLYGVGQSHQPGGGTPSVMMSAKMCARAIAEDFGISS
jgi:phytoene desaturase